MSLFKSTQQGEISQQNRMPTNNINAEKVADKSSQTIQFYYWNSGALTQDAGQAAGTVVIASIGYTNILDSIGSKVGTYKDSSFAFDTGSILTTAKPFIYLDAELHAQDTLENLATKITEDFSNGEYTIDHEHGLIIGKKATNGTSDTASFKIYDSASSVTLESGDLEIGAVELKDATTDTRATIKADNAAAGTPNPIMIGGKYNASDQSYDDGDAGVLQLNDKGQLKVTGGASSVSAEYTSPSDFTATYTSSTTITLSSLPFTITDSSQVVYIKYIPSGGSDSAIIVNGSDGATMTVSSNVVTVNGAGTPFASGDVYEIGLNSQRKAYDASTNSQMVSPLNNIWNQYTDPETLVTAQDLTASYADFGEEIDMRGYTHLRVGIVLDVNDSTDITLKLLGLDESGGSDEYEIEGGTTQAIAHTADAKYSYEFDVKGSPFIQLQAIAGTVGATAGDLTLTISKIWKA